MWGISKMDSTASKKKSRIGMYEVGRTLGEGRYAKVKLGRHIETGSQVAIKIMQKDRLREADKLVRQEISTMKRIKHPHVVRLLEVLASKKNVYIILEYVHGGELFDKIVEKGRLNEDDARKYFRQLIRGVDYCHSRGVYHRDLKPENLLLDSAGNLKISDFGLSVLSHQHRDDGLFHTTCGTPSYVAPEVLDGKGYEGAPADLWSCGIILYVLLAGTLPFNDSNLSNLSLKIHKAELDFSSTFPTEPRKLIRKLLDPNPKTRLTIQGVFENEWFKAGELLETETYDDLQLCPAIDDDLVQDVPIGDSRPVLMNAFEIILALSEGLDLSGLFIEKEETRKKEAKFASTHPANEIMLKIEEFARGLDYRVWSKNYKMNLLSSKPGRKGFISISIEVLEVTPSLYMVDMHKTNGDTLEYCDFQQKLSDGLKDIVWRAEETMESQV